MASGVIKKTLESGTDGIWTYRKYEDGRYHAWYDGGVNLQAGTAFAGGYFHQTGSSLTPPSFSTAVTSFSGYANSAVLCTYVGHTPEFYSYWLNGTAGAVSNVSVHLDMYGTY